MPELIVTKEYREDIVDNDGNFDEEYRYWDYSFDLDGRNYRARIYTDRPREANVFGLDGTRHPEHEEDLRIIGTYLRDEAGIDELKY